MTPSDAARLSALEARERARCAWRRAHTITDWEFIEIGKLLCDNEARDLALMVVRLQGQIEVYRELEGTRPTPPSPPVAERETGAIQLPPSGAYFCGDSTPTPGPSPETIARVTQKLRRARKFALSEDSQSLAAASIDEALRLLDAERETGK